jgi:hypothetical protein
MVRSYSRNNFLDILRDPLAVTMMASIGLHAAFGAFLLPILSKVPPEGKKIETGTVKVVELTPNELQRIPQVPTPIPTPASVTLPPVYQPSPAVAPTVPAATTIPATPVRTPTPKTPTKPKVTKAQPAQPTPKSSGVDFNPETFNNPSPKPTKSPGGKKGEAKPSPKPTPSIKPPQLGNKVTTKPSVTPTPAPNTNAGDDRGSSPQPSPTSASTQPTTPSPTPTGTPNPTPGGSQSSPANGQIGTFYGSFAQAVTSKLQEYYDKYPDLKHIQLPAKKVAYPDKVPCSKVKQPPFVIFIPVFGKTPKNQDPNFGSTLADSEEATVLVANAAADNKDLIDLARSIAAEVAQQADKNRAEVDKDRPVAYSTKVEFDPTTCKN